MYMVLLPKGDQILFLCCLHNSIFNINVMLQIDQLKKLISERKKKISRVRKMNYKHRLILLQLKENSYPNIASGQEIILFINTNLNAILPQ